MEEAIATNPASAGIPVEIINRIASSCINFEAVKVSTFSFGAGIPGGLAMAATIPADLMQYYAHVLRIMQKLAYLYGWQDLVKKDGQLDDETNNILTLFTGIMFGVNGAVLAVQKISEHMAKQIAEKLPQKALTDGVIYPIVKKVAKKLGVEMTKTAFSKGVSKVIPIVGGVVSGGITFAGYRPMAAKLKKHLAGLELADVSFYNKKRRELQAADSTDGIDVGAPVTNAENE